MTSGAEDFGRQLLNLVSELPDTQPIRYFRDRQLAEQPNEWATVQEDMAGLQHEWGRVIIGDFFNKGYLDHHADPHHYDVKALSQRLNKLIEDRTDLADQWPLSGLGAMEPGIFFTLVEVLHDLVSRPRVRVPGMLYTTGQPYAGFAQRPGQGVYRWRVNALLQRYGVAYELAARGEKEGLLIPRLNDPRQDLLDQAGASAHPDDRGRINHAVDLFRKRGATIEERRTAVRNLADVLEHHRSLIKKELLSKDEGALFQIANEFGIRHHNPKQRTDYDEAVFLEWYFWWYLATLQLIYRLHSRRRPEVEEAS